MEPIIIYCYDAWCGWCYGFSKVMTRIAEEYKDQFHFEVLSGGMIFEENPRHISAIASYVQKAYKNVEELTGIQFGEDFLWHMFKPDKSDWFPESTKPAIALCIFKEYFPDSVVQIAADIQYALNYEGRDLTDDEAYRHLVNKYNLSDDDFYSKLHSEEYKEKAYYEFALVKQLNVTGFPTVLLQVSNSKFYLLAQGYTEYDVLKKRIEKVVEEVKS
ncbi:MAG: DsbA family protein [Flavisolibacter sp.]